MLEIILPLIAGLVLFLYSVQNLSELLKATFQTRAQRWMERFTAHDAGSLTVGVLATALLDSSSAVIILTIVLINARILTFRKAMGIVLGANIGTTVSSQIIAMDFGKYSPVLLLVGFILLFIARSEKINKIGQVILYFGVLFFGLFTMENAVEPLRETVQFEAWMRKAESPLTGAALGALVTLVIQSSSATVGMALILAKKGLLSLAGGIAVMLGAELGTCSDTLLATWKGNRQAIKTGLFHLGFNLVSIVLGLFFFGPFVNVVEKVSQGAPLERAIANAHMLFNVLGVVLFFGAIPLAERALDRLLPEKG